MLLAVATVTLNSNSKRTQYLWNLPVYFLAMVIMGSLFRTSYYFFLLLGFVAFITDLVQKCLVAVVGLECFAVVVVVIALLEIVAILVIGLVVVAVPIVIGSVVVTVQKSFNQGLDSIVVTTVSLGLLGI